ncbi:MAG: hypothetical protein GW878_00680 [Acidobacteria bacterium]|nr:hypothetical protein [Acidobacteriota bacterium]
MAIALTVAVQSVTFQQRREKEEELIFRGEQYVEAIRVFRTRNGRFPVSLDELWKAKPRVIRKKFIDPMTGKADWRPVFLGQDGEQVHTGVPGVPTPVAGRMPTPRPAPTPESSSSSGFGPGAGPQGGPIVGVKSRLCDESIKILDGRTRYCDWKFTFDPNKAKKQQMPPGPVSTPRR